MSRDIQRRLKPDREINWQKGCVKRCQNSLHVYPRLKLEINLFKNARYAAKLFFYIRPSKGREQQFFFWSNFCYKKELLTFWQLLSNVLRNSRQPFSFIVTWLAEEVKEPHTYRKEQGTQFKVLWSGLVLWVGASHRVNLIAPFPLGQNCPKKIAQFRYIKILTWLRGLGE